jgi:hypothetical protein
LKTISLFLFIAKKRNRRNDGETVFVSKRVLEDDKFRKYKSRTNVYEVWAGLSASSVGKTHAFHKIKDSLILS